MRWKRNDKKRFSRKVAVITAGFELKTPPYPLDALEPHMSQETLDYLWGKHHQTYVENLNKQILGTDLDGLSCFFHTIKAICFLPSTTPHRHTLRRDKESLGMEPRVFLGVYSTWRWRKAKWRSPQTDRERDFGSFDDFLERFKAAAASNFGSGWTWLAYKANRLDVANAINPLPKEEDKKIVIVKTPNAVNPLPLLTIDTWEHAYYLDFENRRAEYINIFMEKLVSWETVSTRLESAMARAAQGEQEGTDTEDEENLDEEPEVYLDSDIDVSETD
ncbi:hypothetical protein Bca101_010358 [Brassica carinata]